MDGLIQLVTEIGALFCRHHWLLTTAESCTGGGIAQAVTAVSGSSQWFDRGFVTYSNAAKQEMLGVSAALLAQFGAVSEPVAKAMAEGALQHSAATVSIAVTGIAGPAGGSSDKPVGTVCFAWAQIGKETVTVTEHFHGDRAAIRQQTIQFALQRLIK